jgi:hypothetical protein
VGGPTMSVIAFKMSRDQSRSIKMKHGSRLGIRRFRTIVYEPDLLPVQEARGRNLFFTDVDAAIEAAGRFIAVNTPTKNVRRRKGYGSRLKICRIVCKTNCKSSYDKNC